MAEPLDLNRFIKLTTKNALSKNDTKAWYRCVKDNTASGLVSSVATLDDDSEQQNVVMIHQQTKAGHEYLVPLIRDLRPNEVEKVVAAFAKLLDQDFDIETNESTLMANEDGEISVDVANHVAKRTASSKQRHELWARKQSDDGWRYGTKHDTKEKTHPLMRPFDQLPDRYRTPDID